MNLPWLQVEHSTFERAATISILLDIPESLAFWAVMNVWRKAIALADPRAEEPGFLASPEPEKLFFNMTGLVENTNANVTRSRIAEVFTFAGFAEFRHNGVRVRGISRYLEAAMKFEKRATESAERSRKYREQQKKNKEDANANVTRSRTQENATKKRKEKKRKEDLKETPKPPSGKGVSEFSQKSRKPQKPKSPKPPPDPNWNLLVDWLEIISVNAGCAKPNWESWQERSALKELIAGVERNHEHLGLTLGTIGRLWLIGQTNAGKFEPKAFTLRALQANFEKLRCWDGAPAAFEKQKALLPPEPDWLPKAEQPRPPNSAPPPTPVGQGSADNESPPERQPGLFKSILMAAS